MQLINITSEALQATIRRLLPSQAGFSEDLQAQNVITPIIDLTPTAEGSQLPDYLQTAYSHGDTTTDDATNATTTLTSTPGFYRLHGTSIAHASTSAGTTNFVQIADLLTTKVIWQHVSPDVNFAYASTETFDFVVFLDTNDSLQIRSISTQGFISASFRQIADRYGNLVNPNGFTFE